MAARQGNQEPLEPETVAQGTPKKRKGRGRGKPALDVPMVREEAEPENDAPEPTGGRHEIKDIGNPDGRIPKHIPARSKEEETIAEAGNPDIRVPDNLKKEDGLRARRALEARDEEEGGEQGGERREVADGQTPAEEQTSTGQDDTTKGQDGPKEPERRHVPGEKWLSQVRSCLKDRLRYIVGREGVSGDELGEGGNREERRGG
ncbi:hypothetical protein NDU88_008173 [Pleurodeles waltl]|uniref:Uncharacterized protein n=1 Tax=Pleurodeles waltl TaxID=8319 RepID=A0AAV7QTX7_PLEWA|nr:hypothetical protein NDU88_008173 [Pleurodeles waltl]